MARGKSKKKRKLEKIFRSLEDKADIPVQNPWKNAGKCISRNRWNVKISRKVRRHWGRETPNIIKAMMKWDEIKAEGLEPEEEWNDWIDRRDGMRGYWAEADNHFATYRNNVRRNLGLVKNERQMERKIRKIRKLMSKMQTSRS